MKILIVVLLVVLIALQMHLWRGRGGFASVEQLEREKQAQLLENQRLKRRNRSLAAEVDDLKQGSEAIEERARSEIGMIKHGEVFYQVVESLPVAEDDH